MNPKIRRSCLVFFFALLAALLFNFLTGLIPQWGHWHNPGTFIYRLQTDAFLDGRLALFDKPFFPMCDLVWHGGVQQVWGLGVPLLRLPFEVLAKIFHQGYFPDCLIFLFTYMIVSAVVIHVQFNKIPPSKMEFCGRIVITLLFLAAPPFINLIHTLFGVYEEAVCYAYLWSVLLFHLLLLFRAKGGGWLYAALCLLAGFGAFIRPTLGLTGLATVGAAFLLTRTRGLAKGAAWSGLALFAGMSFLLLLSNRARFGAALEFGHSLTLNIIPSNTFATRFSYPFKHEPLLSAIRELLSVIFFQPAIPAHSTQALSFRLDASSTFRYREFYSPFYTPALLLLLGAGLWTGLSKFKDSEIRLYTGWSLAVLLLMGSFYLRTPGISSRYLLDFLAALTAGMAVLPLFYLKTTFKNKYFAPAVFFIVTVVTGTAGSPRPDPLNPGAHRPRTAAVNKKNMVDLYQDAQAEVPRPPLVYRLGKNDEALKIPFNIDGWKFFKDGRVESAIQVYVENPECISLEVTPRSGFPLMESDYSNIAVKIGLEKMEKISETAEGYSKRLMFRLKPKSPYSRGFQVAFIKFVDPAELERRNSPLALTTLSTGCGSLAAPNR